jgi:hypothetical protein
MKTIFFIYISIVAIGFILGVFRYQKADKSIRPVIIYLGLVLFSELVNYWMAKYYRNNMPAFHLLIPIQFLVLGIFFYNNIMDKKIKKSILWTIGGMLLFALVNTIYLQPIKTLPENFMKPITLIYIFWAALLFMQQLDLPAKENIFKNPVFIVTVAVLWFNIISFMFFLLYGFINKYHLPTTYITYIHYFSNLVYYLLLLSAMGFAKLYFKHVRKIL